MPKYLLLSIPLIAALVVALIVYQVTLSSLNPPTEAEIRAAPSWEEAKKRVTEEYRSSPRPNFDANALEEALRRMKENGPIEPVPDAPRTPSEPRQPSTKKKPRVLLSAKDNWRERLRAERDRAKFKAKRAASLWGVMAGVLGYIGLGVYFYRLGHAQPKQSWRDVVASPAPAQAEATTASVERSYDVPAREEAQADYAPDEEVPAEEPIAEEPFYEEAIAEEVATEEPAAEKPTTEPAPSEEPLPEEAPPEEAPEDALADEAPYEPYGPPIDITEIETAYEQERKDRRPKEG